jgi:predicted nucleic acid-binding Zn ribbon protein
MRKLISPSAFILKGSGWYVTDYPSKSRKEGMEAEKKATTGKNGDGTSAAKKKATGKKKPAAKVQAGA